MSAEAVLHDAHVDAWLVFHGIVAPPEFTPAQKTAFKRTATHLFANGTSAPTTVSAAIDKTLRRGQFSPDEGDVIIQRADELTVECIDWLWHGYVARRKLHLIAGPPGVNKTTVAIAFAATLSQSGRWPDGTRAPLGASLIWSGEDGVEDTLLPRLIAHGADLKRVHFVSGATDDKGAKRPFDPARDMDDLTSAALRIDNLASIVIDPVVLTVRGDSNTNGDVRRGLLPLVVLAERTGAAAFGVTHFSKNTAGKHPVERVTGSLAFGAAARVVLAVGRVPEEQGGGRMLVRAKSNIGPDGGGFHFAVTPLQVAGGETIRLEWGKPIDGSAHELLAAIEKATDPDEREAANDADNFLRAVLTDAGGSMNRKQVLAAAQRAGYPERTIERARSRCHVIVKTTGYSKDRHSVWNLPTITATTLPSRFYGSNGSNDDDDSIAAITDTAIVYARAAVMDPDEISSEAEEYRKATRGE